MSAPDKCPHCNADEGVPFLEGATNFMCETIVSGDPDKTRQSDLCKERAARQKAEAELNKLRDEMARCANSVVEAMVCFPNIAEYVSQLESQRDAALQKLAKYEPKTWEDPL